jgi:hypothetical protein
VVLLLNTLISVSFFHMFGRYFGAVIPGFLCVLFSLLPMCLKHSFSRWQAAFTSKFFYGSGNVELVVFLICVDMNFETHLLMQRADPPCAYLYFVSYLPVRRDSHLEYCFVLRALLNRLFSRAHIVVGPATPMYSILYVQRALCRTKY